MAAFVAAVTGEENPADVAPSPFREYDFNPNEPRDSRGRWTTGGSDGGWKNINPSADSQYLTTGEWSKGDPFVDVAKVGGLAKGGIKQIAFTKPPTAGMSKQAQELNDLLSKSPALRQYLQDVAKNSPTVERGGFILKQVTGNVPRYKIVEELPRKPDPTNIRLEATPRNNADKWNGATLPSCPPFGKIDLSQPQPKPDPTYVVQSWWHAHICGWVLDPKSGAPFTGAPVPSIEDEQDSGVPGLMIRYDENTKELRLFIIDRDGKSHELDTKKLFRSPQ